MSTPDLGKAASFFKQLGERFKFFGDGIRDIFQGLGVAMEGVGDGLKLGLGDIGLLLEYVFLFLGSNIGCGIYFITNLRGCIFYYLIEVIGQIVYLPFRIFIWILKQLFKLNIQPQVDKIWGLMEKADKLVYEYAGFHIIHYPHEVRQKCYVCKRLSQRPVNRQGQNVKYDWQKDPDGNDPRILQAIKAKDHQLFKGADEMQAAFAPW
jgi:hypothetical protein